MATGSKGGRSYSDPSYGSVKVLAFNGITAGTRATAIADGLTAMNPITIIDWSISNATLGTGGTSQWVLAATSSNGTSALGTITLAGTHAIGFVAEGSIASEYTLPTGGVLHLYSVLSTAAAFVLTPRVSYREAFVADDN
jgi:hypothetical protein